MKEKILSRLFRSTFRLDDFGKPDLYSWKILTIRKLSLIVSINKFMASDNEVPHTHLGRFISFGLLGRYIELITTDGEEAPHIWRAPWIRSWGSGHTHRIHIFPGEICWTLLFSFIDLEARRKHRYNAWLVSNQ